MGRGNKNRHKRPQIALNALNSESGLGEVGASAKADSRGGTWTRFDVRGMTVQTLSEAELSESKTSSSELWHKAMLQHRMPLFKVAKQSKAG